MYSEWIAAEHYRIHVMELWPDGPRKHAGLAAALSTLHSLESAKSWGASFQCAVCSASRNATPLPSIPRLGERDSPGPAA